MKSGRRWYRVRILTETALPQATRGRPTFRSGTNPKGAACRLEGMNEEQIDFVEKLLLIEQEATKLAETMPAGAARGRVSAG